MKKYYIGFIILSVLTLGLTGYTIYQGAGSKQDAETFEKANKIATNLNNYISKNQEIPANLETIGVADVPKTISYTKKSASTYEFCVSYKHASSGYASNDVSSVLTKAVYGSLSKYNTDYSSSSSYRPSSLYLDYSYKVGKNCQTVEPYIISDSLYNKKSSSFTPSKKPSVTKNASDTERQIDIKALHAQVEAYFAQNGKYPTFSEFNSASFRATNMSGLDASALKDPQGTSEILASKPAKNIYSYEVDAGYGKTCDNKTTDCNYYRLTATLSDGSEYAKVSLN